MVVSVSTGNISHSTQGVTMQASQQTFRIHWPENARDIIHQCQRALTKIASLGYPWYVAAVDESKFNSSKEEDRYSTGTGLPEDPLDILNHVCKVYDEEETCLMKRGVDVACLLVGNFWSHDQTSFHFLCRRQKRDPTFCTRFSVFETRVCSLC